jgi:hypothetical protein
MQNINQTTGRVGRVVVCNYVMHIDMFEMCIIEPLRPTMYNIGGEG